MEAAQHQELDAATRTDIFCQLEELGSLVMESLVERVQDHVDSAVRGVVIKKDIDEQCLPKDS
jgi:hypothetical protein